MLHLSGKYLALAVDITKEKAAELSCREFVMRMLTDPRLRELLEEIRASSGEQHGYRGDNGGSGKAERICL